MDFREEVRILGTLRFLKGDSAEELVQSVLISRNEVIRTVGALIAALRWPEMVLESQKIDVLLQGEYADLLAVLLTAHPELRVHIESRTGVEIDQNRIKRLHSVGLPGLFGMAGNIVAGF